MLPKRAFLIFVIWLTLSCEVYGQENAGSSVAPALMLCYNTSRYLNRESRPPSSINVLIDLIRKVENGASAQDMKEYSIEFIHRFRQDGIVRTESAQTQFSIPFSPIQMQADKNRVLLRRLVPGTAMLFPNETLNDLQLCSLHFMLSNSIDLTQRGDENTVCNRLSRYQRRFGREVRQDVEVFDPKLSSLPKSNIEDEAPADPENPPEDNPEQPPEEGVDAPPADDVDVETVPRALTASTSISTCPVENGVVYTQWGSVQAGTVLAGIAAGLSQQSINSNGFIIDNRYATTLAGDLSEAALHQGTRSGEITVGVSGGWNSTIIPKWYFIERSTNWEMTDAEIRAGLDGLILGLHVQSWYRQFSSLKLSQVLDMYYSPRGVLNTTMRACNRKALLTSVAPEQTLVSETIAFSYELDDYATLAGSLNAAGVETFSTAATSDFLTYVPQLNDVTCTSTGDRVQRASADIIIVLDTQWSYNTIQPALAHLLDNIDVNIYDGSNYTIISGYDGSTIVHTSNSILDYYEFYNRSVHNNYTSGFEVRTAYNEVERIARERMDNATSTGISGGQSLIALFVPYTQSFSEGDRTWLTERREVFRAYQPDLRLLVLGRGSVNSYSDLVFDSTNDVFILSETTDASTITDTISSVVTRIKEVPRRIVNPRCGSGWTGDSSSNSLQQYVEPTGINYYRIAPNYFFGDGTSTLRIRGVSSSSSFVVCNSRTVSQPNQNTTSSSVTCQASTNEITFSLTSACDGYELISSCPPFYFSIEDASSTRTMQCSDRNCRFPDNVRVTINHEGFVCQSGSKKLTASFSVFIILVYFVTLTRV